VAARHAVMRQVLSVPRILRDVGTPHDGKHHAAFVFDACSRQHRVDIGPDRRKPFIAHDVAARMSRSRPAIFPACISRVLTSCIQAEILEVLPELLLDLLAPEQVQGTSNRLRVRGFTGLIHLVVAERCRRPSRSAVIAEEPGVRIA
jgi:hypothetical protein